MKLVESLETKAKTLYDRVPFKLSKNTRHSFAEVLWCVSLGLGALQLWTLWGLWDAGQSGRWQVMDGFGRMWQHPDLNIFFYAAAILLLTQSIMLLAATGLLKMRTREGWQQLFYALLIYVVYGVASLFTEINGFGVFAWVLASSAVAGYFLFQLRGEFTRSSTVPPESDKKSGTK